MSDKTAMMELIEHIKTIWSNQGWEDTVIEKATQLLEKEKEQIINAWKDGLSFDDIPCSAEEYYKITYKQEDEIK